MSMNRKRLMLQETATTLIGMLLGMALTQCFNGEDLIKSTHACIPTQAHITKHSANQRLSP